MLGRCSNSTHTRWCRVRKCSEQRETSNARSLGQSGNTQGCEPTTNRPGAAIASDSTAQSTRCQRTKRLLSFEDVVFKSRVCQQLCIGHQSDSARARRKLAIAQPGTDSGRRRQCLAETSIAPTMAESTRRWTETHTRYVTYSTSLDNVPPTQAFGPQ